MSISSSRPSFCITKHISESYFNRSVPIAKSLYIMIIGLQDSQSAENNIVRWIRAWIIPKVDDSVFSHNSWLTLVSWLTTDDCTSWSSNGIVQPPYLQLISRIYTYHFKVTSLMSKFLSCLFRYQCYNRLTNWRHFITQMTSDGRID